MDEAENKKSFFEGSSPTSNIRVKQMASGRRVEPSHFFKVVLSSTLEDKKLKIPEKFARIFGDELSTVATLTVPNGRVWQVSLIKYGRKIWFNDGWHDFVQHNSISTGYFLVFKYRKNTNFNVLIFDTTACEIQYAYNGKEPEDDKQNSLHQDETEEEDSVEIMDFATPNPTFDSLKNKASAKCPSTMPSHLNQAKTPIGSASVSPIFKCGCEQQNKRPKLEEPAESHTANAEGIDLKRKKTASKVGTHSSDEATEMGEDEFMDLLEEMGICVNQRFRSLAAEERDRVIAAARLFKPKNPSFMVISRSVDVSLRRVYVPANFSHRYISKNDKVIKVLDSDGRKWSMGLAWTPQCFITKLGNFAKKLDDGDICIFELIRRNTLKVSVLKTVKSEL